MTYIKRLIMKGFKSFARETQIDLDRHMNVIVGPNGSGKSNVTDALCFVLGRLSIKSIRAAKASHLIFSGNKTYKGNNEAYVEIVFDNSEKEFALDSDEIIIRRIVRKNGQSIYKINHEIKTRQECIELLNQAGIDPHGFNIVLQGEIEKFVKLPGEERRKIMEEVAGISIYEMRKEKSLKEMERTDEKLKQINAILRERTSYLRNLEEEREQALKFKKLEETKKKCKASILYKNIQEREKELAELLKNISFKQKDIEKKDIHIAKLKQDILILNDKANNITQQIQRSSGLEQDSLIIEISTLKQEIAGMTARKENFENQLIELDRRKQALESSILSYENEIESMSVEKSKDSKKELTDKKSRLEELDELKRQFFVLKSNLSSINNQIEDKKRQIQRIKNESNFILSQMESIEREIKIKNTVEEHKEIIVKLKNEIETDKETISSLEHSLIENEKTSAIQNQVIENSEKVKSQVSKLDICPLCKTKMTEEHVHEVMSKSNNEIHEAKTIIEHSLKQIAEIKHKIHELKDKIAKNSLDVNQRNIDLVKIQSIADKKQQLQRNSEDEKQFISELENFEKRKKDLEQKFSLIKISEEQYETLRIEVNELQRSEERNIGSELTVKQRELERIRLAIKHNSRDKEEISETIKEIKHNLEEKIKIVGKKEEQADVLKQKYQKMFEEKNNYQDKARTLESEMLMMQNEKRLIENDINNFMINKAQINARKETIQQEYTEFEGVEILSMTIDKLQEKLHETELTLARIGSVNLRALEVYDQIKQEYDGIREKVEQLEREKQEILKAIDQIDKKKKKAFVETLEKVNELFSNNFSQLSTKGIVTLEPEDKKEIFNGGLDIIVKVGGGKYFDVTSLSGGEQTLVALSLIFAIQAYRPYAFYIFDEIDAALDRRNSEKLAYLLKKHMKQGQFLIITHNDSIIGESSSVLYGVSMQEGISKVLSLKL